MDIHIPTDERIQRERSRLLREITHLLLEISQDHELPQALWMRIKELEKTDHGSLDSIPRMHAERLKEKK